MKNTILYFCLLFVMSCTTTQKEATNGTKTPPSPPVSEKDMTSCSTRGTVTDFSGLDGCKLLIVLENGKKFLPSKLPRGMQLEAGQEILFGYKEIADGVSICMTEDKIVEVTCLEITGRKPVKKECVDTNNPLEVTWLKDNIIKFHPEQIIKYKFRTDSWAYLHKTNTHRKLYDCQGYLVCEATNDAPKTDSCVDVYLNNLRNGKVVWQGEGPGN